MPAQMGYLSIYRALMPPPPEPVKVISESDFEAVLHPGPLKIRYQTAVHDPFAVGAIDLDYQTRSFPEGSYILIAVRPQAEAALTGAGWSAAYDRFSQVVAILDLAFPGMAYEKVYEETALLRGEQLFIAPERGVDIGLVHKYRHEDVTTVLPARFADLKSLPDTDRERFVLASRWFRRGNDATNPIDRVLFYWMTLEVFPTIKGSDVVGAVLKLLADRVYPGVPKLKELLNIGPICGCRGDIIHDGKASVGTLKELETIRDHVERLQAITRTCLRLLAGQPPGSDLDRYVLRTAALP